MIIVIGVPVILPILMPGMDEDQFKKDGGTRFNTATPITTEAKTQYSRKQPKLQNPGWSTDTAVVGEEVTLSVDLVDQYVYANVTFKIWEEGADREKDMPVAMLKGQNFDGKAEVTTRFRKPKMDAEVDEIKYIFTAKSFRCEKVENGTITIEKIKPEFNNLKWLWIDKEEKTDPNDFIYRELVEVKEGKISFEWQTRYYDDLSLLKKDDKLEYVFKTY